MFGSVLVVALMSLFANGVAPGNEASVDAVFGDAVFGDAVFGDAIFGDAIFGDEGMTGDKGTSGSLGKLSVYNTLA